MPLFQRVLYTWILRPGIRRTMQTNIRVAALRLASSVEVSDNGCPIFVPYDTFISVGG